MPDEPPTKSDLVSTALKEYEALRKEIDVRTDKTKTYGWPVILVALTAAGGYKPEIVPSEIALMFVPAVAMTVAALAANANRDTYRIRKAIAHVEDRVFALSGEPLLCHHTFKVLHWKRKGRARLPFAIFFAVAYIAVSLIWLDNLSQATLNRINESSKYLLLGVLLSPVIFFLYNEWMTEQLRKESFRTRLLTYLRVCEKAPRRRGRLVYLSKAPAKFRRRDSK